LPLESIVTYKFGWCLGEETVWNKTIRTNYTDSDSSGNYATTLRKLDGPS
jgi:hypothetical protein